MQEIITFIMEIIGTIAFAASGAMVGAVSYTHLTLPTTPYV